MTADSTAPDRPEARLAGALPFLHPFCRQDTDNQSRRGLWEYMGVRGDRQFGRIAQGV